MVGILGHNHPILAVAQQTYLKVLSVTPSGQGKDSHTNLDFWCLDIVFQRLDYAAIGDESSQSLELPASSPIGHFLSGISQNPGKRPSSVTAIRFLFSSRDGQVARSDFLERRLECCEQIARAASFLSPLQDVEAVTPHHPKSASEILRMLRTAIGAVQLQEELYLGNPQSTLRALDKALKDRLAFPWLSPPIQRLVRRRVCWVQGREDVESSRRAYEAAIALGISLVVLDEAGHWLEGDTGPYAHLREAFVITNIDPDEGFPARIVAAVRAYPQQIDGIVTVSDVRLPAVAKACEILGLPTSPSEAYKIAADKAKTRSLEWSASETHVLSDGKAALEDFLATHGHALSYPMIVKPCIGWSSDCVAKVSDQEGLIAAVGKASRRHANAAKRSTSVILEPYIDGPEVDANFVLLDGEILFYDINDDFPSLGDDENASHEDNFQETQNVIPSALPREEQLVIHDSIHKSILRQGFTTGVFHCEARLCYSKVEYVQVDRELTDVVGKSQPPHQKVRVYLLEVNARPPGYLETVAVLLSYGVDYYALRLLLSIGPAEYGRVRALAQPFLDGPQFHLSFMIIPQTKAGIMKTMDAGAEFLERHPEIRRRVPDYKTTKKGGSVLEGPSASSLWWIAYFSVFSRRSRRDLLETVRYIQGNFTYEIE